MLYILATHNRRFEGHVGERFEIPPADVIEVVADDTDLLYITTLFTRRVNDSVVTTIPLSFRPANAWYGDTAKSIAYALSSSWFKVN